MIARLLRDKGVREYVGAARLLRQSLPEASFLLLGEIDSHNPAGVEEEEIKDWVQEGAIRYLGATDDVRPFIRGVAAIVLPSYREGLPRTLLEGAAMGRPLIATDVPGCREVVRDGITGFLCEPRSVASLAAAMERLARASNEIRMRMGAQARAMAEREFDQAIVTETYLDVVRHLPDRPRSRRPVTARQRCD
jgi:glycosyltransferase involved in cell wall biosynthesis